MAFCNKCGNQLPDGANNCPNCGAPAGNTQQNTQNAQDFVNNMMNTNDTTSQFDPQDINNNKGMSVLAYIGFLFLVPLLACPNSKFARYHTNQGLVLFLLEFASCIGSEKPAIRRRVVVLPQPEEPSRLTNSPRSTFRLKSRRITFWP